MQILTQTNTTPSPRLLPKISQTATLFSTGSLHAQSLAASRVEQALSEVASSISSFTPKPGPQRAWLLQLQIWLLLTEVFLMLDQPNGAVLSLQEATNIFPLSHHIMYTVRDGSSKKKISSFYVVALYISNTSRVSKIK